MSVCAGSWATRWAWMHGATVGLPPGVWAHSPLWATVGHDLGLAGVVVALWGPRWLWGLCVLVGVDPHLVVACWCGLH